MKGDPNVIEVLNEVLTAELTAVNQYFIHAKMCQDWGYQDLAAYAKAESIDEMKHAEACIDRILYLGGVPNMQRYFKINIGQDVKEQLEHDLNLEQGAVERLNNGVKICVDAGDHGSRQLLETILSEEEHHIEWLETQIELIGKIGVEQYLATKLGATSSEH
jgi:bacterioferritin